jgi:hypothetical protein
MGATANRTPLRRRVHHWCVETRHSARESHRHPRSWFQFSRTLAFPGLRVTILIEHLQEA